MADEEQIILPERYKRLSSITSTGTQYIDTEYIPTNNTGFWIDSIDNNNTSNYVMGMNETADWNSNKRMYIRTSGNLLYGWMTYTTVQNINGYNKRVVASLNYLNSKKALWVLDGNTYESSSLADLTFTPSKSLYISAVNYGGSPSIYISKFQIFEAKISEGTEVVRHFIPAYDTYSARGCMYEVVEGKAYYNKGTGDFTYDLGVEDTHLGILHKLPEGFTKVNYLIANGSQYIDTNYIPTNETGYYVEGQGYTTSETYYFGTRNESSTDTRIYFCATNNVNWGWGTYGNLITDAAYQRQENKISHNFLNSRIAKTRVNEKDFVYNLPTLSFTPNKNIFLFGLNNGGTLISGLKGRIDTFLISEGDQIVRHFVPCLDADEIPCMYELYTGTVHYNQGSGQFSYPRVYTNAPINLPANYTKCVYLQSSGVQYIDTLFVPDNETGTYIEAQYLGNADLIPFGCSNGTQHVIPPHFNTSSKLSYWAFGCGRQSAFYYDKGDDLIYNSSVNLYNDRSVKLNTEDTKWSAMIGSLATAFPTISLWLFSYNADNKTIPNIGKFSGRIFRAKITQGDYLVHDFVPCLDENKRPCMYDLVTQTPFYNQSGGVEFAYCVEHQLPSNFAKLDYLESGNGQYIKTGYVPTNNTGLYIDAYNTVARTDWTQPFSLRETNGNTYVSVGRVNKATNGAAFGWGAYTSPGGTGDNRYEATLNWLNDKKSIITAPAFAQRVNTLSDLPFTPTFDLCMFGIHYYDGTYNGSSYRIYRAKISEGSSIVRDYVPAYDEVKNKPCMYDLINNVAYYNDGTGEFVMPPKREGSYTGFAQLGGIGNRLGCLIGDELPGGYVRLNYIESTGEQKIVFDYEGSIHTGMRGKYQQTEFPGGLTAYAGENKEGTRITLTNITPKTSFAAPVFGWGLYAYFYNTPRFNSEYYDIIEAATNWMEDSAGSIWFDGKTSTNVQTTFTQDGTYSEITIATGKYKHYWYKISEGQNIVRNFVPCLDQYGVPCMYETITQQPFYNTGNGEYLYG